MTIHPTLARVTQRIAERSRATRRPYLDRIKQSTRRRPLREALPCANLAHGFAASAQPDKLVARRVDRPNLAIVSAYNDVLSAHQPLGRFPDLIREAARQVGAVAQVAGGVPAMCDGVTQGEPGMELSLFSRDVIAMATAVALSHNLFDAVLCLGVCDKIVPGLLVGALHFGHLPAIFVPVGPMTSGLSNDEKSRLRQAFAQGQADRQTLFEAESKSYHGPGTCTFYGTANTNQALLEVMGLLLPGAAFVQFGTPLREALTAESVRRAAQITSLGEEYTPIGRMVDERTVANGIVGLLATGGSTNHTIHLIAIARAAGILVNWDDFADLSSSVPLLARVYPNGKADVNQFQAAGGMGFLIRELLNQGLLHADVETVAGRGGLSRYAEEPWLDNGRLGWRPAPTTSRDESVLVPTSRPLAAEGGIKLLTGNLGRAVIKTSTIESSRRVVEAPAMVFHTQEEVKVAFETGRLRRDFVAVVRFQGPRANGMPELHKLTPLLGALQDQGFKVALVTDGRMSGASGKIPAAIHLTPEAKGGGPLSRVRDGDVIRLDAERGLLESKVPEAEWKARTAASADLSMNQQGMGRELFEVFRVHATGAEEGAMAYSAVGAPHEVTDGIGKETKKLTKQTTRHRRHRRRSA